MEAEGDFGGTVMLSTQYGEYKKGTQRIALHHSYGRLVVWAWITFARDW